MTVMESSSSLSDLGQHLSRVHLGQLLTTCKCSITEVTEVERGNTQPREALE